MKRCVLLEPAAEAVSNASIPMPRIYQLPPSEGRKLLEKTQSSPIAYAPARIEFAKISTGKWGEIPVYWVIPPVVAAPAHVILYIHGAGWVFGSFHTHEKLVRELACRTGCIVIFPEYSRSPDVQYPVANEQCYQILCQLPSLLQRVHCSLNPHTLTIAGDSAGGNMVIALTLMAKNRKGPLIHKQLLYYPVTNACFNTPSYQKFAVDYYLYRDGMIWFWNQYAPAVTDRKQITASPLRAPIEALRGLPEALLINGQADVLRDEGEAYAESLRLAGVSVTALRFQAIIHDFVMLNSLDQTNACRAAMDASVEWIIRKNEIGC